MADKSFKGVITEFFEREWKDRNSGDDIILRSFKINSENRFFRTGTTELKQGVGTAISFVADGKGNVDLKTVEEIDASEAPAPKSQRSGGTRSSSGGTANGYWEAKAKRDIEVTEPRISYSAAQKNATELVTAGSRHPVLWAGG